MLMEGVRLLKDVGEADAPQTLPTLTDVGEADASPTSVRLGVSAPRYVTSLVSNIVRTKAGWWGRE